MDLRDLLLSRFFFFFHFLFLFSSSLIEVINKKCIILTEVYGTRTIDVQAGVCGYNVYYSIPIVQRNK